MTECSRCGDCCERIPFVWRQADITRRLADPYCAGKSRANLQFISDHWHLLDVKWWRGDDRAHPGREHDGDCCLYEHGGWYTCDAFDPVGRLCTAHSSRPPVCRDYPWYDSHLKGAENRAEGNWLSPRCSFRADIPEGSVGALLPIVGVT